MIDLAKALGKTDATFLMNFVIALIDLQKACHVDQLKMSDYGITYDKDK
ncbi:iron-containing alcohol dehydrogenase [Sporanaerobium hydrogeniformans]|nr:iron-containing alcohol dehydrogenase [Sporanaerobium hydrogeniformans]